MARRIKTPTAEQKKSLDTANNLIEMAIQGRRNSGILDRGRKFDLYFFGEHRIKARARHLGNSVRNKFAEITENKIAHFTDVRPRWVFNPQEESDLFKAKAVQQVIGDVLWNYIEWDNSEENKGEESVLEAFGSGTSHIKTVVDRNGFPNYHPLPTEAVAPDPHARKKSNMRFIVHFSISSQKEIERRYNVQLTAEAVPEAMMSGHPAHTQPEITYQGNTGNTAENVWALIQDGLNRSGQTKDTLGRVVVAEVWLEDHTTEPIPFDISETDLEHAALAQGQEAEPLEDDNHPRHIEAHRAFLKGLNEAEDADLITVINDHIEQHESFNGERKRRKYPRGRVITVSQNQLLRDEPNPLPIHWRDVFIKWNWLNVRNSYYGKPGGHDLYDTQDDLNHRRNAITQNINLLNNGIRKWKQSIFNTFEKVTNMIGLNIPVRNESDVTVDFGKPLPPQFFQDYLVLQDDMERQAGNDDIQQGRFPSGSPPGVTVNQLLQEGKARTRLPLRHYAGALVQMARNAIAIMSSDLFDEETVFRIVGQDNQPELIRWRELSEAAGLMDIRIDVAEMEASSRLERFKKSAELFQLGIYDLEATLEDLDDPKKYGVLQRNNIRAQLEAALEQAAFENEQLKKIINTELNRGQGQTNGNVGIFQTGE